MEGGAAALVLPAAATLDGEVGGVALADWAVALPEDVCEVDTGAAVGGVGLADAAAPTAAAAGT